MKKFNKKVIVSLCIALLVSMFTFIGISATSESADPEVVALNVAYGDRIQLIVAVDPAGNDAADIEVTYTFNGKTHNAALHPEMTYGDAKYPVFYTDGIPMKDIGDDVAFEAHIKGGEAGDTYSTSAANYFYSRLFKDGIINANLDTDDYKRMVLYKECLAYGASAQDVLVNIGNANPETLVTDYVFVWSADENVRIDGVNTSKTLLPNTSVTPVYLDGTITEWTLLDAEGVVVDTVAYGESIEITEHTEIVAGAVVEDTVTVMDYENGASNAYVSTKDSDSNTVSGAWATGDGLTMGTTTSGDNTYLQVRNTKNSNKTGITTVNFGNSVQTGNCYTFQTKVMIAGGTGGFNFARIKFVNNNGGEALNLMLGMTANASGATNKPHLAIATTGSNASIAAGTTLFDLNEKAVTTNNWCTIRVEFYFTGAGTATEENTYMKLYVDDVLAFDGLASWATGANISNAEIEHISAGAIHNTCYDDIFFTRTDKAYKAGNEYAE